MAQRSIWPRTFRNDPKLRQYFLEGVAPTGKSLGVGSYGSVVEVEYKRTSCAAKQMHELFLIPENEGVRDTIQRYQRECQLMAGLRHPNITQFLGLCFLESSRLPLLVMERLEMSVDDLLECSPNIPLPVKLSILTDTCSGLVYLHGMESPIVHRDLTASNVLLNSALSAKITDLGNSRMVNMKPGQLAKTLSKYPGTLVYMPPEALNESHRYGPSLDVFSFGHLSLYIFTQVFPGELLAATDIDPNNAGHVIGRTEVERREVYINNLKGHFSYSHPALVELVSQCLHNNPEERPCSEEIQGRLHAMKVEVNKLYGNIGREINILNVLVMKEMKKKDKAIKDLQDSEDRLEAEIRELTASNVRLEREKQNIETEKLRIIENNNQVQAEKNHLVSQKNQLELEKSQIREDSHQLLSEKNQLVVEKNQLVGEKKRLVVEKNQLGAENNQLKRENSQLQVDKQQIQQQHEDGKQQLEAEKQSLQDNLRDLRRELQRAHKLLGSDVVLQGSGPVTFSLQLDWITLQLDWKHGPDMPSARSGRIQSVEVEEKVYVGGGFTEKAEDDYIVMAYDMKFSRWHTLPPYSARWFAMTTINNKLVLVGGLDSHYHNVNQLGVWQTDSNQWTHPFPPMPTPRFEPSVTSYKHWLVVAGGHREGSLSTVEVLDVDNMQWSTAPSIPRPQEKMKSTLVNDMWYLWGGLCDSTQTPDVYSVSLEALVSHSTSESFNMWRTLPHLNCTSSCPINLGGSLLALGGYNKGSNKSFSSIQRYVFKTNSWVLAGELPYRMHDCTSIMIAEKLHVFGGCSDTQTLSTYYFSNRF